MIENTDSAENTVLWKRHVKWIWTVFLQISHYL